MCHLFFGHENFSRSLKLFFSILYTYEEKIRRVGCSFFPYVLNENLAGVDLVIVDIVRLSNNLIFSFR